MSGTFIKMGPQYECKLCDPIFIKFNMIRTFQYTVYHIRYMIYRISYDMIHVPHLQFKLKNQRKQRPSNNENFTANFDLFHFRLKLLNIY